LFVRVSKKTVDDGQQHPPDDEDEPVIAVTVESVGFVKPEVVRVVRTLPVNKETINHPPDFFS
jgi:hypothetical protein